MKKYGCLFIFLLMASYAGAQNQVGLNPPSMRWYQIQTPTGKIIFPKGMDSAARRVAGLMQYEWVHDSSISLLHRYKRVPVILQTLSTLPAGFSTPAPWRNEYYLTPPQDLFLGATPWLDGLTLHENRHTLQFIQALGGVGIAYRVLMGQTGWLLNSLMTQPLWFREGDAVIGETIYTGAGRGRLPSFHMEYRAMRLAGYDYSYEKAEYGSFRNFVPNPYRIGYYIDSKARRDYGNDIWAQVLFSTYYRKGFIYPFSRSLKKFTGMGTKAFYDATVKELDSTWRHMDASLKLSPSRPVGPQKAKVYTSWRFPQYLPDGSMVVLKNALNEIYTYYRIGKDSSVKRLFAPGLYTDDHRSSVVAGNIMAWAESSFDERYINQDYSIIKIYDFATGKTRKLSRRSRYFSPAPAHDGKRLAAISIDTLERCQLVILDMESGRAIKRIPNPDQLYLAQPRWTDDDRYIIAVAVDKDGNALVQIDPQSGAMIKLMPDTRTDISRPCPSGAYVFFSAGYTGIDNIYALQTATGRIFRVTSVRFGACEPAISPDGKHLLYSEYTADGYCLREAELNPASWAPLPGTASDITFHLPIMAKEGKNLNLQTFDTIYTVRKYHALTSGLFHVYGWLPLPNIPEYGAEFYAQNIMSNALGTLGLLYNTNEHNLHSYLRYTYAGLYPLIDIGYAYANRRKGVVAEGPDWHTSNREWTDNSLSAGLRFPFRLTQGTHITNLTLRLGYAYYDVQAMDTSREPVLRQHFTFNSVNATLNFTRLRMQARQEIEPRWGQALSVSYQKALVHMPERLAVSSRLFFPGLVKTHSLNVALSYKKEEVLDTYRFTDDFIMPRGFKPAPFETYYAAYANYELPIWYPDIALSSVAFLQRFRLNLFADYGLGINHGLQWKQPATGAELFLDLRLFRLFQMSMGVRYSYVLDKSTPLAMPFQFLVTRFELAN